MAPDNPSSREADARVEEALLETFPASDAPASRTPAPGPIPSCRGDVNLQVLFAARPVGLPRPENFTLVERPVPRPEDGEVLVRVVYLSLDPAMRVWMNEGRSYTEALVPGEVMRGLTAGVVVESHYPGLAAGALVEGLLGWQRYAVVPGKKLQPVHAPVDVPLPKALGALGLTGLTAYFGLLDVGQLRAGETLLVSGAAGAVGSVAGQLGKIRGARVVGIAGTPDKCRWLTEELGFDAAIDYRATADLNHAIRAACPGGVDVFFDNVGGEVLDAALRRLNLHARVVLCGAISQYNATGPMRGPSNYMALLTHRARMEGFVVLDYARRFPEAREKLAAWVAEGKLRTREEIVRGLENAPAALLRLFDGTHSGKLLIQVSDQP